MKISKSLTRIWSLLTFLFALGFVGWSIALIITTDQRRTDVANRAYYISELSKMESTVQSLEVFFNTSDYSDSVQTSWKQNFNRLSESKDYLRAEFVEIKETQNVITELDSILDNLNHLFEISMNNAKREQDNTEVKNQSYQTIRTAALKIKSIVMLFRRQMGILSIELGNKWDQLFILAIISCILAFTTAYLVYVSNKELKKRKQAEEILHKQAQELKTANTSLNDQTKKMTNMIQDLDRAKKETDNILHYVKDGLFLLNSDLKIKSQYSHALESILCEKDLANLSFSNYLKGKIDDQNYDASIDYLEMLFNKDVDENLIQELNPLSFIELHFDKNEPSKYLAFEFRRIFEYSTIIEIIATVNDITEKVKLKKNLEESKEQSKKQMNWLLSILNVDPPMLKEFIKSSQNEISEINDVMNNLEQALRENLQSIYRSMHAIKGNASLLELDFISEKAHEVEEIISKYKDLTTIEKEDHQELQEKINEIFGMFDEVKGMIDKISKIHDQFRPKRSFENQVLIKSINNLVQRLAQDYKKKVEVKFDGFEGSHIPFQHRIIIRDILVQLTRNAIYHGIESKEEREKMQKSATGKIQISTRLETDSMYSIKFVDDGRGLDEVKLREKAIKLGEWDESETNTWNESTAADIIFIPGITTADSADLAAGRGMGMDIIKEKVEKLKGKILINSQSGRGCEFTINLPRNKQ